MSTNAILERMNAAANAELDAIEQEAAPDAVDAAETTTEAQAEATNEQEASPTVEPAAEDEADQKAEADDPDADELEDLRKLLDGEQEASDDVPAPTIELDAEESLILEEIRQKYPNPEDVLAHFVRQEKNAQSGFGSYKEKLVAMAELAKSQFEEFHEPTHRKFAEREVNDDLVQQYDLDREGLAEWKEANAKFYERLVKSQLDDRRKAHDEWRNKGLSELDAQIEKINGDLGKRNKERAETLRKRMDALMPEIGDDQMLGRYVWDQLHYEGEDAPKTDQQRLVAAKQQRAQDLISTLKSGKGLGKEVEDEAMRLVLRTPRFAAALKAAAKPKTPVQARPVRQLEKTTAKAETEEAPTSKPKRVTQDSIMENVNRSIEDMLRSQVS